MKQKGINMSKNIIVTLTSAESKRLIAKSVVQLPEIKKAYENGIISIQLSTSNAYIYEELTGNKINISNHACGYIFAADG